MSTAFFYSALTFVGVIAALGGWLVWWGLLRQEDQLDARFDHHINELEKWKTKAARQIVFGERE